LAVCTSAGRTGTGAAPIESYTIITTDANEIMAGLYDRMPVIVHEGDYDAWLDSTNGNTALLKELLKPYPPRRCEPIP
jgi:putative SOS response-associated peptidase YedK